MAIKKKTAPKRAAIKKASPAARPAAPTAVPAAGPSSGGNKTGLILALVVLVIAALIGEGYYMARAKARLQKEFLALAPIVQHTIPSTRSLCGDKDGNFIRLNGADRTWKVQKFDPSMQLMAEYKPVGAQEQLVNALQASVAEDGTVYVLQADGGVKILDAKLRYLGQFNSKIQSPVGMDIDPKGQILVASHTDNKVGVFNDKGDLLTEFGAVGSASGPLSGPWRLEVLSDGRVIVAENLPNGVRVRVLAPDYKPMKSFIIPTEELKIFELTGMGVDKQDRIYFNDAPGTNGIVIYNLKSGKLYGFGRTTKDGQQIVSPGSVGADKWTGDVYIDFIPGVLKCRLNQD